LLKTQQPAGDRGKEGVCRTGAGAWKRDLSARRVAGGGTGARRDMRARRRSPNHIGEGIPGSIRIPALSFTGLITLVKLLNLSELQSRWQFPHP